MDAVIYARLERWEHNNKLLDEREQLCRTWAEERQYRVVEAFRDRSCTGTTLDRPAFTELCEFVMKRRVNAIMITELSQLSSSPRDGALLADVFDELGIAVYSVREGHITGYHLMHAEPKKSLRGHLRHPARRSGVPQ